MQPLQSTHFRILPLLLFTSLSVCGGTVFSQERSFRLAPLFADNMVLPQQRDVPIWGKGIPGTSVTISAPWGKEKKTVVRPDSSWIAVLKTIKAGGPYQVAITHGDSTAILRNVLLGEVWLCSGQSNMEMPLEGWPPTDTVMNGGAEMRNAHYPGIRFFTVKSMV